MKHIRLSHYLVGIIFCSSYCIAAIHILHDLAPPIIDHAAHYLVLPVILPFMLYQETVYVTPAVRDFPYLMAVYPIYFAVLLSPLAWLAMKNKPKQPNHVIDPTRYARGS